MDRVASDLPTAQPRPRFASSIAHWLLFAVLLTPTLALAQANGQWLALLRNGNYAQIETETIAFQEGFANGKSSEYDQRQAYRQFYNLTNEDLQHLEQWLVAHPDTYAGRLILGTWFKRRGLELRGGAWISDTPPENIHNLRVTHALAMRHLQESLSLTPSPYMSVFHLLDLEGVSADWKYSLQKAAAQMLPANRLVRSRYMRSLMPRWGGSTDAMRNYLAEAATDGATSDGLKELEAIIEDDAGDEALRAGNKALAALHFGKALKLGSAVGGEVPQELIHSWANRCKLPELQSFCSTP